jgi:hypothetical protein
MMEVHAKKGTLLHMALLAFLDSSVGSADFTLGYGAEVEEPPFN